MLMLGCSFAEYPFRLDPSVLKGSDLAVYRAVVGLGLTASVQPLIETCYERTEEGAYLWQQEEDEDEDEDEDEYEDEDEDEDEDEEEQTPPGDFQQLYKGEKSNIITSDDYVRCCHTP
jgi:hypothetical protein